MMNAKLFVYRIKHYNKNIYRNKFCLRDLDILCYIVSFIRLFVCLGFWGEFSLSVCVCVRVYGCCQDFFINCSFTLQVTGRLQGMKQMSVPQMSAVTLPVFTRQKALGFLSREISKISSIIKRCWERKNKNIQSNWNHESSFLFSVNCKWSRATGKIVL